MDAHDIYSQGSNNVVPEQDLVYYRNLWNCNVAAGAEMIPADRAKMLLDQTGLSPATLSDIWSNCDIGNKASLTWPEFVNALRWVTYYQAQAYNPEVNITQPALPRPPPIIPHPPTLNLHHQPPPSYNMPIGIAAGQDPFVVSDEDRKEYTILFSKHENSSGFIDAMAAKQVFVQSELARETLFHIWDLADRRKRGQLDLGEFIVASHLVVVANAFGTVPPTVPPALEIEFDLPHESLPKNVSTDLLNPHGMPNDMMPEQENNYNKKSNESIESSPKGSLAKLVSPRPRDLIESIIEGDRVMTEYLKEFNDKLSDRQFSLQDLSAELVNELKEKREQLTNQIEINAKSCAKLTQLETEISELREEYTETAALRKEAGLQNNSISQKMAMLQEDKEFLKRAIQNIRIDIKNATGIAGDLELATKSANSSLNSINNNRQMIRETLNAVKSRYTTEKAETDDLERTLKRLEEEKLRLSDNNRQQLEVINQGLQDAAHMSNSLERDQNTILNQVKDFARDERVYITPSIPATVQNHRDDGFKHLPSQPTNNNTNSLLSLGAVPNGNISGDNCGILSGGGGTGVTAGGGSLRYSTGGGNGGGGGSINDVPRDLKGVLHGSSGINSVQDKQHNQYSGNSGSTNWVQFNHVGQ